MLREPAAFPDYQAPQTVKLVEENPKKDKSQEHIWLRELVQEYLTIDHEYKPDIQSLSPEDRVILNQVGRAVLTFSGYLRQDAESAYAALDKAVAEQDMFLLFRSNSGHPTAPHIIHVIEGRPAKVQPWPVWPNILLLLLTIFSVLFTGTSIAIGEIGLTDPTAAEAMGGSIPSILMELWRGWPYALSIMLILGAHEMGHYFMVRYHKAQATLPYFIPAWLISAFGTLGATIILREPLKNRKMLLDVGAAGPIAGFIVAFPILLWGLATSPIVPLAPGTVEGNSLFYIFAKLLVFKEILPSATQDVLINQLAMAAWAGLLVTSINMIPLGQLDGGHVMYALFGDKARFAYIPVLGSLIMLALFSGQSTWLLFFGMLLFLGRFYAVPMEDISPLDTPRRFIAFIALALFVLTFVPFPFYERVAVETLPLDSQAALHWGTAAVVALCLLPRYLRRSRG